MKRYPTRQSVKRTAALAGVLALVLATVPVAPMLDADGDLALLSGAAYAKGKGGGHGGEGGGHGGEGRGHGRGHNGHADLGDDDDHGHAVGRGHTSHGNGLGLGHDKARGYGHHHDANYDGDHHEGTHDHAHDGHHGDYSGQHSQDRSFSAARDNARRDFGRVGAKAKEVWNGLWD